jgi:hypothetical protein
MTTIPLNRVVAFVGPYMSAIAGGIASWLVARVNIAALPGLDQNNLKTGIAGALTWLLVSGLTWAGHSKWLTGHQIAMEADARVNAAAMGLAVAAPAAAVVPAAAPATTTSNGNGNGHVADAEEAVNAMVVEDDATEPDEGMDDGMDEGLPSDDEELAAPPDPVAYTPDEPVGVS